MNLNLLLFLMIGDLKARWKRYLLLGISVSFSICALFALDLFSKRIGQTIGQDTKNILAADYQIQAWRNPDQKVIKAVKDLAGPSNVILQSDFLTTAFFKKGESFTVAARALEGAFPFYGSFVTEPKTLVETLKDKPLAIVDSALQARGFKIGDRFKLGKITFEIASFLKEEPQTVASALALGPRIIIHQNQAKETGLISKGSRVFNMILVKSDLNAKTFIAKFREQVPDPFWRVITPDKANAQAERVIQRTKGFLSLVAIVGLILGALGVFVVFRSQFFLQLPQFGALRCLGIDRKNLLIFLFAQGLCVAVIGTLVGALGGYALERAIAEGAKSFLSINFVDPNPWPTFLLCLLISLTTVSIATLVPAFDLVNIPILSALRSQNNTDSRALLKLQQLIWPVGATFLLCYFLTFDWSLTGYFILIFTIALLAFGALAWLLLKGLNSLHISRPFSLRHIVLGIVREPRGPMLVFVCLGLGIFLVNTLLFVSYSLREQVNVSQRDSVPNLILIGVTPDVREEIASQIKTPITWTPTTLARLQKLNGETIVENNEEEVFDREQRLRTREYTITRRSTLTDGEELVKGESMFGKPEAEIIRASLEVEFSKRIKLKVGDQFTLSIGGIPLEARVDSLRRVKWNNFKPNFFIVLNDGDIADAPMDYVGISRVDPSLVASYQSLIASKFPEVTVFDGGALSKRLMRLMEQLGFAVQSVGLFALCSCVLVFLGILLSRRQSKAIELALFRTIGLPSWGVRFLFIGEILVLAAISMTLAFLLAYFAYQILNVYYLEITIEGLPHETLTIFYIGLLFLLILGGAFIFQGLLKLHPLEALRSSDEN